MLARKDRSGNPVDDLVGLHADQLAPAGLPSVTSSTFDATPHPPLTPSAVDEWCRLRVDNFREAVCALTEAVELAAKRQQQQSRALADALEELSLERQRTQALQREVETLREFFRQQESERERDRRSSDAVAILLHRTAEAVE
jgi:TolA-binding protein